MYLAYTERAIQSLSTQEIFEYSFSNDQFSKKTNTRSRFLKAANIRRFHFSSVRNFSRDVTILVPRIPRSFHVLFFNQRFNAFFDHINRRIKSRALTHDL